MEDAQRYKLKTPNRLRLIYVDDIPKDIESSCKGIHSLFDESEEDGVSIINEHSFGQKISDEDIVYVNKNTQVEFLYLKAANEITFGHIVLALAKYPNAQITIFHPHRTANEESMSLSILDTNLDELNTEDWRVSNESSRGKKRKMSSTTNRNEIDAAQVLQDFKLEFLLRESQT